MKIYPLSDIFPDTRRNSLVTKMTEKESGLIIVSSPPGGGKTTALYSVADVIARAGRTVNVILPKDYTYIPDVEDLKGTWNFFETDPTAEGLQEALDRISDTREALLFLDIEEIWIKTALQKAQAGYLALVAMDCTSFGIDLADSIRVKGVFDALQKMGVSNTDIASCLSGIVGQWLLLKLCRHCRVQSTIELRKIKEIFPGAANLKTMWTAAGKKRCDECNTSGFLGRFAITEILDIHASEKEGIAEYLKSGHLPTWDEQNHQSFVQSVLVNMERGNLGMDMFKARVAELL